MKLYLLSATIALALMLPASAQDRLQKILDAKVLRVGTTMDTPMFSMRDANITSKE